MHMFQKLVEYKHTTTTHDKINKWYSTTKVEIISFDIQRHIKVLD